MKSIVPCPSCQHQMRIPSDRHIRFNCPKCSAFIEAKNGRVFSFQEPIDISSQPPWWKQKNKLIKVGLISLLVFVIGSIAYSISQREHRAIAFLRADPKQDHIDQYLLFYPNGQYIDEVYQLRDSVAFLKAVADVENYCNTATCDCADLQELHERKAKYRPDLVAEAYGACLFKAAKGTQPFPPLEAYRLAFPNGPLLDSMEKIENQLWGTLSVLYAQQNATRAISPQARAFIEALLVYGQESHQQRIDITFSNVFALKDWEDYPKEVHQRLDEMIEIDRVISSHNYPAPTASPPPSIQSYLKSNNANLQNLIVNALQARLDSVFIPNPFRLELASTTQLDSIPCITIDYTVSTLSTEFGELDVPDLYIQTTFVDNYLQSSEGERRLADLLTRAKRGEDVTQELEALKRTQETAALNVKTGIFQNYLLASQINWELSFSIPDQTQKYTLTSESRPNSTFSNIHSNTDAYQRMMESAFVNYAIQIAEDFGL